MAEFRLIEQTENWVALMKPAGFHVHPPEDATHRVPRDKVVLYQLRRQLDRFVYPVHRLDAGTSGVLLMALDSAAASFLARQFQERRVKKVYHAVVRGWTPEAGRIDIPLELDSTGEPAESATRYKRLSTCEFPVPVGNRHRTARYSLLEVEPETGRYHQIRRHMNRISHPVVGDATHGDSKHNKFFRETQGVPGLCLKAHRLEFVAPERGWVRLEAPDSPNWKKLRRFFDPRSELERV